VSDILKKSRLNWKLKVSNTADNAGITQSQVRVTMYRRMQELNSLCVSKLSQQLSPVEYESSLDFFLYVYLGFCVFFMLA